MTLMTAAELYEVPETSVDELRNTDLLEQIDYAGMWTGLGLGRSALVTCRPGWIRGLVSRDE
ncbi:hypothetical protein AKJ09_11103 [Labilithrix luteola]|uniref:Uncharacterized protein n=1 Tax=Labilithrix luteola TaxID=1391654 RepID=A0A0K1QG74_9BACT|nr:hypothetical protein AKJ09_11103 [Labilithrix luteola]